MAKVVRFASLGVGNANPTTWNDGVDLSQQTSLEDNCNCAIDKHFADQESKICNNAMSEVKKLHASNSQANRITSNENTVRLQRNISRNKVTLEQFSPRVVHDSSSDEKSEDGMMAKDDIKKNDMQYSLVWIRENLLNIRQLDEDIARQFMGIYYKIQRFKLERTLSYHSEMLESIVHEALEDDIHEHEEFSDNYPECCRRVGLTKRNIIERKYSLA